MRLELMLPDGGEPDEFQTLDGRKVAFELFKLAYQLLTPYVGGNEKDAGLLFRVLAVDAVSEAIGEAEERGTWPHKIFSSGSDEEIAAHFEQSKVLTEAMLKHDVSAEGSSH